jgi:hypothetical protein
MITGVERKPEASRVFAEQCDLAEVEERVIPEPQKTYVPELLYALGTTADEFVVAGAQAMKFMMERARATKDIDFRSRRSETA